MQLFGPKASAGGTSAGAKSPASASEPFLNILRLGSLRTVFDAAPPQRLPTPLQRRGRALAEKLRIKGAERGRMNTISGPRIGVALGGGSARGLTHIPYIEAMDELGLQPSVIAGTSIGALIGAGWAAGMRGQELREHSFEVLGTLRVIAGRLWQHQVQGIGGLFRGKFSVQLEAMSVVDAFTPSSFPNDFKDLRTPLYVVATDFQSWHQTVFNSGKLRPAIAASIAIPSLFRPVAHQNHLLVDGSVVNPLPLDQADIDTDFTIGIDVNGDPSEGLHKTNHHPLDVWFGSAQIMMHSLIAHQMAAYPPDVYVRPHVARFGAHEYWRVREIITHVDAEKDRFKRILTRKIEDYIQNRIEPVETKTAT
jgi:NTE family protein